jgi:hypothetical protein
MSFSGSPSVAGMNAGRSTAPNLTACSPRRSGSCALPFPSVNWLPSSVADAFPPGAETLPAKRWQGIASTGIGNPPSFAADDESFATISTTEKTVHHRPGAPAGS